MVQIKLECTELNTEQSRNHYGRFVIEPLERDQGITLGNTLRRVLLANIPGTAITLVKIQGISHEFDTIPGVREDVLDILLNMKAVVLRGYSLKPQYGKLSVSGSTTVTASHLDLPANINIVDPDQYIATLSQNVSLEMEFKIETDQGYRLLEGKSDNLLTLGYLDIDAVFNPIIKVNYTVDKSKCNDFLNGESLILEIWTNGSISPEAALGKAGNILFDLFQRIKSINLSENNINQPLLDFDEWDDTECESDEDDIDDSTFYKQEENKFYQQKSRSSFQSLSESNNHTKFTRYEEDDEWDDTEFESDEDDIDDSTFYEQLEFRLRHDKMTQKD